jgi:hypothetical protein
LRTSLIQYRFSLKSELGIAQTITFETIRQAAEAVAKGKVDVQLFTICYPEDHEVIPSFFTRLPNLNRSVRDVLSNPNVKKYPLIRDVFQSLYDHSQADYFIFYEHGYFPDASFLCGGTAAGARWVRCLAHQPQRNFGKVFNSCSITVDVCRIR